MTKTLNGMYRAIGIDSIILDKKNQKVADKKRENQAPL
jgi:hypothetical protein